ncbi:FtsX-like permease family protein [Actinoplanes derwentensis]|uniref:Putative ABC transport system permease protein n=1 Tax=Actinoplanes derwentensis TaxID=113562 RepID=A0A1H1VFF1_9ACTN|nr:ABC transporter permease [Actinoplanes derwentensis]GID83714.1 membrane protein [Actinoplanes derwentensis]SDS83453.1 putative ABC transport system permease protein [Actinoplanes derwentensis]
MNVSVLRTQLSGVLRRPGRTLMTGLSVLVAAFVVFGTVLAYQVVTRTTLDTFSQTPTGVSLVAFAAGGYPVSPQQITEIRATAGVVRVTGRTTVSFTVGDESTGNRLDVLSDPGSGPLSRLTLVSGAYPSGARQIAVDRRAAGRLGVTAGSRLRLHLGDEAEPVTVTVTGVVDGPRDDTERAWAPDHVVAGLSGEEGFRRVDVLAEPGADLIAMTTTISDRLLRDPTAYVSVTTGDAMRVREARDAVSQFDQLFALIGMFVAIAVVAAALVATSTFRIVFAQRLRQLALLRTIGAQRGQLVFALAVEGAVVGLVTGTAGVLLAQAAGLVAPALAGLAGHTLSGPGVPVGAAVAVVIGAGLLTVGAVLAPAFSAAGVAPLQALRSASTAAAERGIEAPRLVSGLILVAAAASLGAVTGARMDTGGNELLLYIVGVGALGFGALIVLGPLLIRPVLAVAGWPLRRLGPTGRLAVSGIGGAPRRAAAVSVVVALGVTMLAGTVVGINSLQLWTDQEMAARNPADLALIAEEPDGFEQAVAAVRAEPRFRDVTPFRLGDFTAANLGFSHSAIQIDMAGLPALRSLQASAGTITALAPGRAILSAPAAADLNAAVGDTVTLQSEGATGKVSVEVVAILTGEGPLRSGAVLTAADLDSLGVSGPGVLADIASGTRDEALAVLRRIAAPAGAEVAVLADARDKADAEVSSLFAAALGLLGLTVLIAVVGVGTTTGLSVLERTRESGLLRALGLTRARLRLMIGVEAGLYGLVGAILGIVLGVPMAWLTLEALRLDLPLTFPAGWLATILLAITAITVLAGLLPARRAAKVSPVAALAID